MRSDEIARLLEKENREKKRTGSNIYKRVSTRRGGSWLYSMRVPTKKEHKELSGEVSTFNLNKILPCEEFEKKNKSDQKMMMEFWRNHYKTSTIMKEMGIDKNKFYRFIDDLGIKKSDKTNTAFNRITLSEDELNMYLNDKDNLLDYESFRMIASSQQDILFEEYLKRYSSMSKLANNWEGASISTLYYINSRINKKKNASETKKEPKTKKNQPISVEKGNSVSLKEKENTDSIHSEMVRNPTEVSDETIEIEGNASFVEVPAEEKNSASIEDIKPSLPSYVSGEHTVDVTMENAIKENSFSFSLKGTYSKESIVRRLNLLLEEINEAEEPLNINISIKG